MQIINLSTSPNVFISMPVEALIDAGIEPGDAFEIGVEDEKIIIQKDTYTHCSEHHKLQYPAHGIHH